MYAWQEQIGKQNLLKVPEIFAPKMSQAADMKLHFLIIEILSIWSITWQKEKQSHHQYKSLMMGICLLSKL